MDIRDLSEPARVLLRHLEHRMRMVATAWRRDECSPTIILFQHRADVSPRRWIGQSPLGKGHASNTGTDKAIVSIGPDHLPRRTVFEPNEHLLLIRALPQPVRECLVYAPLPRVGVDRSPYSLSGLRVFGQAMPVGGYPLMRRDGRAMENDVILTPTAMRDIYRPLAALLQEVPKASLIPTRVPAIG